MAAPMQAKQQMLIMVAERIALAGIPIKMT